MLCVLQAPFFYQRLLMVKKFRNFFLLLISVFLIFNAPSALAKKILPHHKATSHQEHVKKHLKKKLQLTKKHALHKKHHPKKHQRQRYAQHRNNSSAQTEIDSAIANGISSNPLNHDLAVVNLTSINQSSFPDNMAGTVKRDIVDFVQKTVANLHYSSYQLGGRHFDLARGVYILDCSNFVDHILQNVYPDAYSNLVDSTGADTPASGHYFNFFRELTAVSAGYWNKIEDIEKLQPGDVLVFRYKNSRGVETGGHVMVVMDKPEHASDVYFVRVADSAPSRHSEDTRHFRESGIGIGTLLLKANPKTGRPSAFAWGINSYWNKNVKFAMARPVKMNQTG